MEPLSPAVESLQQLIAFPSISSTSNGAISQWVGDQLRSLGFEVEITSYRDPNQVEKFNVVGRRDPASAESQREGLAYFCHTDVVPVGDWTGPGGEPFQGVVDADRLYGRGSCDMKGSLAAMMTAAAQVSPDEQRGPLWIVCTADEEVGFLGAKQLRKHSEAYHHLAQQQPVAIIGEPTRLAVVNAHKGIIGLQITSRGRAAHSSTTDGINANVAMVPMLQTLLQLHEKSLHETCYHDGRFDPPYLSWNFGVSDHNAAINVTPEKSVAWVSLRPMPHISGADLVQAARERAEQLGLEFRIIEGGSPFWVEPDEDFVQELCRLSHSQPKTVCYGTDGGEFQELKRRIVFGPGDIAQAHTADEWIELAQLQHGVEMYRRAIQRWCGAG